MCHASLCDTEEKFRWPLLGRGAKMLLVPSVTFAFLLLLISEISPEFLSPSLPETERFLNILSTKCPTVTPLSHDCLPLAHNTIRLSTP